MTTRPRVPGTRKLYVLPVIDDDLDELTKNAIATGNVCATSGQCPCCGAIGEVHPDPELDGIFHYVFRHEDYCIVIAAGAA